MPQVILRIADEYDEPARAALGAALAQLGARRLWRWSGHAGSQHIERWWYLLRGRIIRVEAETYAGLAVRAPHDIVERLRDAVRSAASVGPMA
jgi:hypothetical protein